MRRHAARRVATVALCAATLSCGKLVLAAIPNVEIVTLLCALYGYTFGWGGVLSAAVFVCLEPLSYGFGPWVLTYALHWPTVALLFALLAHARLKNRWALAGVALLLTAWFGVLSSLVDVGLFFGRFDRFFTRFSILYARGIPFYLTQIGCNAVLFPLLFPRLCRALSRVAKR